MFWRLIVSYAILLVGALVVLGWFLSRRVQTFEMDRVEATLHDRAVLLREALHGIKGETPQQQVERIRGNDSDLRITLLDDKGKVLAETHRDPEQLQNHATRPEVRSAVARGYGRDIRRSESVGLDLMYVAIPALPDDAPVAIVRVAQPLARLREQLGSVEVLVLSTAAGAGLLAVLVTVFLTRRMVRPVEEMAHAAEQIAGGRYGSRVYTSGQGAIALLGRSFNNMSERLAEQFAQLEADRAQLKTILSGMIEGVVALDAEQHILFANERAALLLEFTASTPTEVVGRKLWTVVRQRPLLDMVERAMHSREPQQQELNWYGPNERSVTVHAARLAGAGPRGAVLVVHDTTNLRRLERLRREFVANVSHELKTPLSVIKACVETLLDGAVDDPDHSRKFLEQVAEQSERLYRLILDLLSLARIESGTETFELQTVDVGQTAQDSVERQRARSRAKGQSLTVIPPSSEVHAWADDDAVAEILDNLIDNAVKYTPDGGAIQVRWWNDGDWAAIEVKDNGIGIPQSDLARIFERFYRVDKARSRELGGTGLGLSIVKHLVQSMGGAVTAISQSGEGATFTVHLPTRPGRDLVSEPPA